MALADEKAWFIQNRAMIAQQYQGQWVLVRDKMVRGAYPTYDAAFTAGIAQFGPQGGFLVKQALLHDPREEAV